METTVQAKPQAGSALEKLLRLEDAPDRHDIPYAELRAAQIEAINERFQSRRGEIKLLGHRAEQGRVSEVRALKDLVPLLFAHTTYKSYPEAWFTEGKWDRMTRWLDTVVTHRVRGVDGKGAADIDDWLERLSAAGHYVSCSSGTTGKCSMLDSSAADLGTAKRSMVEAFEWSTGLPPRNQFKLISASSIALSPRLLATLAGSRESYGDGEDNGLPGPPMTIGAISKMVTLRRRITEGTATPGEIAAFEAATAERQATMDQAIVLTAERVVANRHRPMIIAGLVSGLYRVAEIVRGLGYTGADFHPDNAMNSGGGLKGAVLPPDYLQYILETFNIQPRRDARNYSMQDINVAMPRCTAGRYHVPPMVVLLPLDPGGDELLAQEGELEARAGFFDLTLDGRWGGLITGDKVHVHFGKCACGHEGPTIGSDITRYADLPGGDKITCAGTIDAYVRGVA